MAVESTPQANETIALAVAIPTIPFNTLVEKHPTPSFEANG
jgi:hypothetical protein